MCAPQTSATSSPLQLRLPDVSIYRPAEGYQLEQPYIRLHEKVSVALLTRLLAERILSVTRDALTLRLRCRGQTLTSDLTLGEVERSLWRPHAAVGQLLQIVMDWPAAPPG